LFPEVKYHSLTYTVGLPLACGQTLHTDGQTEKCVNPCSLYLCNFCTSNFFVNCDFNALL